MASQHARTYVPAEDEASRLRNVLDATASMPDANRPQLVVPGLGVIDLPEPVMDLLLQVVRSVAAGEGITVVPRHRMLTTQEAAEFLGISRPTLVRRLESGEIAFQRYGRHRKVRLQDLVEFQERSRKERSDALGRMTELAQEADMYTRTTGLPPRTR